MSTLGQLVQLVIKLDKEAQVLHRDISPGNVLHQGGQLLLIDFDLATNGSEAMDDLDGAKQGTLDTMAIDLFDALRKGKVKHKAKHDLKSIVYLLWYVLWVQLSPSAETPAELQMWRFWCFGDCEKTNLWTLQGLRDLQWEKYRDKFAKVRKAISPILDELVEALMSNNPLGWTYKGVQTDVDIVSIAVSYEKAFERARSRFEAAEQDDSEQVLKRRWPSSRAEATITTFIRSHLT
ncbi:hypothetical protein BCR35DRAFT_333838 [Leucosporidium creatinivorum]|uniref:Protein kinase domain-containing protein n=1 Tax=Leucosporidium creatinivorum TaxID=106004 RepID=A0A1Y2EMX5_9BASI|nr:hypothetical protein BCR35DRAFT_333838 [Leucosporidium creatinivorum]